MLEFFEQNCDFCERYFAGNDWLVQRIVFCLIGHQERLNEDLQLRRIMFMMMFARGGGGIFEDSSPQAKEPYPGISGTKKVSAEDFPTECPLCAEPAISEDGAKRVFVETNCEHVLCETCSRRSWESECKNYNKCPMCRALIEMFTLLEMLEEPEKPEESEE